MTKAPIYLSLLAGLAAAGTAAHAQGTISASATLYGVQNGGNYDYTLTLQNDSSSTDPIQTFWFAWFPGADLMSSAPSDVQTPANWNSYIQGGVVYSGGYPYPDGYSIEFATMNSGSALAPGGSMVFTFTSPDSPDTMSGLSSYPYFFPNAYPIGISYIYMNGASDAGVEPSGDFASFTTMLVTPPVPEPGTVSLLVLGGGVLLLLGRRTQRQRGGAGVM